MLNMTVVGRIGRDVELRRTQGGDSVCNVAIGCNYGRRDGDNGQPTQWVEGTLWGTRTEALAEHLTKGKQIVVVLKDVHIETFEGREGPGHKLVGTITELEFGASPQNSGQGGGQRQQPQSRAPAQRQQPQRQQTRGGGSTGFDDMDDDIPFVSSAFAHDAVMPLERRKARTDCR